MSMQDSISEMFTSIRNGQRSQKKRVYISFSKIKLEIVRVLEREGFILKCNIVKEDKPFLEIFLKYYQKKQPVIDSLKRVSRPGLRVYKKSGALPQVMSGMGIVIISTSKGVMTDKEARYHNVGGEIICYVS